MILLGGPTEKFLGRHLPRKLCAAFRANYGRRLTENALNMTVKSAGIIIIIIFALRFTKRTLRVLLS